jgi:hypothetical protein
MKEEKEGYVCVCVCRQNDSDLLIGGCRVALGTTKNTQKERERLLFLKILTSVAFLG